MTYEEFLAQLDRAKQLDPRLFKHDSRHRSTIEEILDCEAMLGCSFPTSVVQYWTKFGGGDIGSAVYTTLPDDHFYIVRGNETAFSSDDKTFIALSPNFCGDEYGIRLIDGKWSDRIYFFDHETRGIMSPPEYANIFECVVKTTFPD